MTDQSGHPPVASDTAVIALQAQVGDRVRAARAAKGMSRRVLSEASGVSPRYLAQLESGEGNNHQSPKVELGNHILVVVAYHHRRSLAS